MKQYNVIFACGARIEGVKEIAPIGTRICVFNNDSLPRRPQIDGRNANCFSCKGTRRKASRKEFEFWTERDKELNREPTGRSISCKIMSIEEFEGE